MATLVNDVHSELNETPVAEIVAIDSLEAEREATARRRRSRPADHRRRP